MIDIRKGLATTALAGLIILPAAAFAQTTVQTTYTTTMTQTGPSTPTVGELDGSLRLSVSDGVLSGYYVPSDEISFIPVVGGLQDGRYWLDIGGNTSLRVYGSVGKDGSLIGTAAPSLDGPRETAEGYSQTFAFVAKPAAN